MEISKLGLRDTWPWTSVHICKFLLNCQLAKLLLNSMCLSICTLCFLRCFMLQCTEKVHQFFFARNLVMCKQETIIKIKQAFGNEIPGATQIKEWHRHLSSWTPDEGDKHFDRPPNVKGSWNGWESAQFRMENCWIITEEIWNKMKVAYGSIQVAWVCHAAAKFVPQLLKHKQQDAHLEVTRDVLECSNQNLDIMKRNNYKRWVVDLWVQFGNKCPVITKEDTTRTLKA